MGELHLEIIVDPSAVSVEANVGRPQVAYRETAAGQSRRSGRFVRQTGGSGQYADVVINLHPTAPGEGLSFTDIIKGGNIPKEYIPAVDAESARR
jgi:elongation factor G